MSMANDMDRPAKPRAKGGGLGETIKIVIQALLLALIVRTFLFQPFNIPSESMKATLLVNDYLFVSKYSYGYSRYSFPWGINVFGLFEWKPGRDEVTDIHVPGETVTRKVKVLGLPGEVVNIDGGKVSVRPASSPKAGGQEYTVPEGKYFVANADGSPLDPALIKEGDASVRFVPIEWFDKFSPRVWSAPPKRGDIVVFKLPRDNSTDYIKRVIGLPGDRIQMIDGALYINGQPVKREKIPDYVTTDDFGAKENVPRWRETLPNGVSYETLDQDPNGFEDNTPIYEVPPGHYFMMGDNRDNSTDSRVPQPAGVGYVPFENLVGRAEVIFFSVDKNAHAWEFWKWPWTIRWDRLFKTL